MDLRFSLATGALEDSSRMGSAKRDVAQLLTHASARSDARSHHARRSTA